MCVARMHASVVVSVTKIVVCDLVFRDIVSFRLFLLCFTHISCLVVAGARGDAKRWEKLDCAGYFQRGSKLRVCVCV